MMNKNFNKKVGWKTFKRSLIRWDFATARRIVRMAWEALSVRDAISQGTDGGTVR